MTRSFTATSLSRSSPTGPSPTPNRPRTLSEGSPQPSHFSPHPHVATLFLTSTPRAASTTWSMELVTGPSARRSPAPGPAPGEGRAAPRRPNSPAVSTPPTSAASSTATSSHRTSTSPRTASSRSSDFGLARLAPRPVGGGARPHDRDRDGPAGAVIGSPPYMAPEQLLGKPVRCPERPLLGRSRPRRARDGPASLRQPKWGSPSTDAILHEPPPPPSSLSALGLPRPRVGDPEGPRQGPGSPLPDREGAAGRPGAPGAGRNVQHARRRRTEGRRGRRSRPAAVPSPVDCWRARPDRASLRCVAASAAAAATRRGHPADHRARPARRFPIGFGRRMANGSTTRCGSGRRLPPLPGALVRRGADEIPFPYRLGYVLDYVRSQSSLLMTGATEIAEERQLFLVSVPPGVCDAWGPQGGARLRVAGRAADRAPLRASSATPNRRRAHGRLGLSPGSRDPTLGMAPRMGARWATPAVCPDLRPAVARAPLDLGDLGCGRAGRRSMDRCRRGSGRRRSPLHRAPRREELRPRSQRPLCHRRRDLVSVVAARCASHRRSDELLGAGFAERQGCLRDRGPSAWRLVRIDPRSGRPHPYAGGVSAGYADVSPDGGWVAWVTHPRGELWKSRPDGSERTQLSAPDTTVFLARWSPDGRSLALVGCCPGRAADGPGSDRGGRRRRGGPGAIEAGGAILGLLLASGRRADSLLPLVQPPAWRVRDRRPFPQGVAPRRRRGPALPEVLAVRSRSGVATRGTRWSSNIESAGRADRTGKTSISEPCPIPTGLATGRPSSLWTPSDAVSSASLSTPGDVRC